MKYYDKNAKFIRTSILSSFPHPLRSLRHAGLYFQERSFCMKTPNSEVEKLTLKVKYLTEQIKTLTRVPRECWAQLHKGLNQDEFKDIFPYHIYARAKLPTPNKMFTQMIWMERIAPLPSNMVRAKTDLHTQHARKNILSNNSP